MKYSTAILIGEKELQGKTNESISEKVGWKPRVISKVLSGNKNVKLSQIEQIADVLGFSVQVEFQKKETDSDVALTN